MSNKKSKLNFQGKDSFSRMNFLFQASMLMSSRNPVLSAYYGSLCKNIGKKSVLRIDPELKRFLCKKCSLAQRPGITSNISIEPEFESQRRTTNIDEETYLSVNCLKCGHTRRLKINPNLNFWLENADSVAETTRLSTERNESAKDSSVIHEQQAGCISSCKSVIKISK